MTNITMGEEKKSGYGHVASPLFTKLPAELRLKIYREAFSGSQAIIERVSPRSSALILEPTDHNQLLLTCHQVYEEACSTYWTMTAVNLGYQYSMDRVGLQRVLGVIPNHARSFIEELHGTRVDRCSKMGFREFLDQFQKLRTVRLVGVFEEDHSMCGCDCDGPFWCSDHKDNALQVVGLSSDDLAISGEPLEVAVLQKATHFDGSVLTYVDTFINHTTGKVFEPEERVDDDEGFQKVL